MNIVVCYPVPLDNDEIWQTFKPFAERFAETWRASPPGVKLELAVMCCVNSVTSEVQKIFEGLPVSSFFHYDGHGMDLGAQQYLSSLADDDTFQINMTSRCYFHRPGWGAKLLAARNSGGPGLYGVSASHEGGKLHLCTRGHCYDVADFKFYPHQIYTRDQGVFFELGDGSLTEWFSDIGRNAVVVGWERDHLVSGWYERGFESTYFKSPNRFRHGDQSDMLFWDKHSDAYRTANDEEKLILERNALGLAVTNG